MYESSEEELVELLKARGIAAERWVTAEFQSLPDRLIPVDTTIWLAEGSATFKAGGANYSMQPGDTIHLPSTTLLVVTGGMSGCVCYEAARVFSGNSTETV